MAQKGNLRFISSSFRQDSEDQAWSLKNDLVEPRGTSTSKTD